MAEETAITTQPQSRRKEVESFVRDLDPNSVVGECQYSCMPQLNAMNSLFTSQCVLIVISLVCRME